MQSGMIGRSVKAVSLSVADPQGAQAECGMWRSQAARLARKRPSAFSPLWLPLPCSRKRPASVQLAPTYRHNKFPTATAFGESLAASRRTSSPLSQILDSCIIKWRCALSISNQRRNKRLSPLLPP